MVALPAVKFVFLAIRQVTRPVARQIVSRANTKRGVTYRMCIGLGRFSLGLSGVISEWTRAEEQKQREAKKKSEEAQQAKIAQAAQKEVEEAAEIAKKAAEAAMDMVSGKSTGNSPAGGGPTTTAATAPDGLPLKVEVPTNPSAPAATPTPTPPQPAAAAASLPPPTPPSSNTVTPPPATAATVIPRSRSLLQSVVYGPQLKDSPSITYDSTVFLDPSRTVGEAARVFIRFPGLSSWDVFRQTFLAPFPEDRLVAAGADLMIELVAYTVLCTLLVVELIQQSRTTAAKEAHVAARLEAIEAKVNELVENSNTSMAYPPVEELPPVPELKVSGRLGVLWDAVSGGAGLIGSAFSSSDGEKEKSSSSAFTGSAEERERMAQSGKAVVPRREPGANLARAPPRDPAVKISKYDDSAVFQVELDKLLRNTVVVGEKRAV